MKFSCPGRPGVRDLCTPGVRIELHCVTKTTHLKKNTDEILGDFDTTRVQVYPIFPSSSGTASFFPSFRFPFNHNFGNRVGSILSTCLYQMSCFRVISSNIVSGWMH